MGQLNERINAGSDAHQIRVGVIIQTVGGLLVAAILWAVGFLGVVARAVWSAVTWAWHQVTTSRTLPTWVVLIVLVYTITVTLLLIRHRRPVSALVFKAEDRANAERRRSARELSRVQKKVMRAMAEYDGTAPTLDEVAEEIGTKQLRAEPIVEELEALGYVQIVHEADEEPVVALTRAGRDYLIAKGMV